MTIQSVIKHIESLFIRKGFMTKLCVNEDYTKNVHDIVFIMIISCEFKSDTSDTFADYYHLSHVLPSLSRCLLANIVVELNLIECYCEIIKELPIDISEELFIELLPCFRKLNPELSLSQIFIVLKSIISIISIADSSNKTVKFCISII